MVLSGREKATIFLSILGADVSSRVLRYLPDEIADLIAAGINHLPTPSPEALSEVIEEYQSFLALPQSSYVPPQAIQAAPKKSYAILMYERPQTAAFLISLLPEEERADALHSMQRDKALIEELVKGLKTNPLTPKLDENMRAAFAGKLF